MDGSPVPSSGNRREHLYLCSQWPLFAYLTPFGGPVNMTIQPLARGLLTHQRSEVNLRVFRLQPNTEPTPVVPQGRCP